MKMQDLGIHEDFQKVLCVVDFDNLPEEKQKIALNVLYFLIRNIEKSDEEILSGWRIHKKITPSSPMGVRHGKGE